MTLLCTAFATAQTYDDSKLSVAVDFGTGTFFGRSNLSSFGVNYRGEYKNGFNGNIKVNYLMDKEVQMGVKFNFSSVCENYNRIVAEQNGQVTDDVNLLYIAPQVGYRRKLTEKWYFDCMVGLGYMHYQSQSLYNGTERECSKGFLGSNADLGLTRHLFGNLYMGANVSLTGGQTSSLEEKAEGKKETIKLDKWNRIRILKADVALSIKVLL